MTFFDENFGRPGHQIRHLKKGVFRRGSGPFFASFHLYIRYHKKDDLSSTFLIEFSMKIFVYTIDKREKKVYNE